MRRDAGRTNSDKFEALAPLMDERMTRLWAAAEAHALGPGGASVVTRATGIRGKRIWMGRKDLDELARNPPQDPPRKQRVRRPGAGRKPLTETDTTLVKDLESLIDPVTRGDPESALRWTCKSTSKLAEALKQMGHEVGETSVRRLLGELDTACRRTPRFARERTIRTGTRSSSTSTRKPRRFWRPTNP